MNHEENIVQLTLFFRGKKYPVRAYRNQYYSLMTLISSHLVIPGFGLCSGMGSCGSCLVNISEKNSSVRSLVLSCQIQVNDDLENTVTAIDIKGFGVI